MAKQYNRVMLGRGGQFSEECHKGGYIGAGFYIPEDLSAHLFKNWRDFNKHYVPIYMQNNPTKSRMNAGLSCGFLWTICTGLHIGDVVLCPRGNGEYLVGEISGDDIYAPGSNLLHRRQVKWYDKVIRRADMSEKLRHSTGSIGTCCDITRFGEEIEALLSGKTMPQVASDAKSSASVQMHYLERDLHPLFCTYLRDKQEIYAKTIFHEKSNNKAKEQKWVHPDIIGVRYSGLNTDAAKSLLRAVDAQKSICLYSFEMKKEINSDYDLKEYFFQALSNSSWANKGYLVAYFINEDLKQEMERLNAAFGIGIIMLQAHSGDTQILFEAREKEIDYTTLDKLCKINPDVRTFIEKINKVLTAPKDYAKGSQNELENICDAIFKTDEELEKYCQEKNIPY